MLNLEELLAANAYPGRGIMLGQTAEGKAVLVYFIMGRSANSRNRIFEVTDDGIRTKAYDEAKVEDPSLIIYNPVRVLSNEAVVVTNGDHTDTIRDFAERVIDEALVDPPAEDAYLGGAFRAALSTRTFEPDGPNWTPRISGIIEPDGSYRMAILKTLEGNTACAVRQFFEYETPQAGVGHFISTYVGDGSPLPSFVGEPMCVAVPQGNAEEISGALWKALNEDNKVSLYVRTIDFAEGVSEFAILNKNE